jgi:hypothetical protein
MEAAILKGTHLFNPGEPEGPSGLTYWLNAQFAQRRPASAPSSAGIEDHFAEFERINAINRMRMQQMHMPGISSQPAPGMPVIPYAPTIPNHPGQYQPPNPYGPALLGTGSP